MNHTPQNTTPIAFVNVNVVPMDSERILPGQTVIVRGDRISEIGPVDAIAIPEGAQRIDGDGKYLMPGLVDMHVHIGSLRQTYEMHFALLVANGVTTIRNMCGGRRHLKLREEIREGKHIAPALFTAGPIISGNPSPFGDKVVLETPEQARQVVNDHKTAGYDFIKANNLSVEIYDALMEAAMNHGVPVAGHPEKVGIEHALATRQHSVEHLVGYERYLEGEDSPFFGKPGRWPGDRIDIAWQFMDERKIPGIARATREAGTWNCATLVLYNCVMMTRDQGKQKLKLPYMKYVPMDTKQWWLASTLGGERLRGESRALTEFGFSAQECRDAPFRNGKRLTKALHDAEAGIVLGTDAPNPFVVHGFSVHQELQNLVDAGLTPYEAIKAGSRDAAECLGELDEFGMITVGLRADLLLVDDNPLMDVGNVNKRVGVMLRGNWLPQSELQSMLDAVAEKHTIDESSDGIVLHGRLYSRELLEYMADEIHKGMLVEEILSSNRIFLTGSGDSESLARVSAMKFTQAGIQAYIVGDETAPAIEKDNQLIAISLSGGSEATEAVAYTARWSGARITLLTGASESWLKDISSLSFVLGSASPVAYAAQNSKARTTLLTGVFERWITNTFSISFIPKPASPRADFDKAVDLFIDEVIALIAEKQG